MLRRAPTACATSCAVVAARGYSSTSSSSAASSSYQKPITGTQMCDPMVGRRENIPLGQLRYDHLGPRTGTHIRFNLMSENQKNKSGILTTDDMTGRRAGETPLRWVEDPKNWAELNKADWEDAKKNDKKMYVMPRVFQ